MWGDADWAPDEEPGSSHTHGEFIAFGQAAVRPSAQNTTSSVGPTKNMTADDANTWILQRTPSTFQVDDYRIFPVK